MKEARETTRPFGPPQGGGNLSEHDEEPLAGFVCFTVLKDFSACLCEEFIASHKKSVLQCFRRQMMDS